MAKTHLPATLARVERGEEVLIACGDTPAAVVQPGRAAGQLPLTTSDRAFETANGVRVVG
jgi:antitoxin (DNA-binding transcriptional repressor) of toxin-antitoxin stability system